MDIGQGASSASVENEDPDVGKPFARPRLKRRRLTYMRPSFIAVRQNPAHYVLDFSEDSTRIERTVCNLVLSDKRSVTVVGLPGTGKTVMLRGLAYHSAVMNTFRDGICLIHLGPEITIESTFKHLFDVMHRLGGLSHKKRIETLLRRKNDHIQCMEAVQRFFKDKRFLLMLDNLCESTPEVLQVLSVLATQRRSTAISKMTVLTSTRSVQIARTFSGASVMQIPLHGHFDDVSLDIFCAHSAFDRSYFDSLCASSDSPARVMLRRCSGLPLALAVVGGAVKRLFIKATTEEAKSSIWTHYKNYLTNNFAQFGEICGLFKMLDSCVLDLSNTKDWQLSIKPRDALCSLALFKKGTWVPTIILQRLWSLESHRETVKVIQVLARLCFILQEVRNGQLGISIPDIVVDYCCQLAKQGQGIRIWHQRFLTSFVTTTTKEAMENGESTVKVEKTSTKSNEEAQYLKNNIAYHLSQVLDFSETGTNANPSFLAATSRFFRNHLPQDFQVPNELT
ncbi:hypothetical protein BWQ96_01306 [Gracilariopsis chorda]|uniref:NB-ARC domain-containing protein n=1 Tax=Gracilariopsis chorda TaxID=448386 RepID=A0A2V3J3L0_9FLOR|nr:hypothetical protein BWQ96_01306 [Gracilariopsis chorda]|eukprot:PXF48964.1 hypothetical protein BWQ96_01306 [Gracilariopsis chorda]